MSTAPLRALKPSTKSLRDSPLGSESAETEDAENEDAASEDAELEFPDDVEPLGITGQLVGAHGVAAKIESTSSAEY